MHYLCRMQFSSKKISHTIHYEIISKIKKNAAIPKTFIHIIPDKKIFKKEINKFHKIDFNLQRQIPFRLLLLKSVKKSLQIFFNRLKKNERGAEKSLNPYSNNFML